MKLMYNNASPFSRKVRVLAHELGLTDAISFYDTGLISPVRPNEEVVAANPVGKVPVLLLNDTTVLYDSRVICEYLNHLAGACYVPWNAPSKFDAKRLEALVDDALNTCVAVRYEMAHRPEPLLWPAWAEKQLVRIQRTLDYLGSVKVQEGFETPLTVATIAVGCFLGYVDFRSIDPTWRDRNPDLAEWFEGFGGRPSMVHTRPNAY